MSTVPDVGPNPPVAVSIPFYEYVPYRLAVTAYHDAAILWRSEPGRVIWGTSSEGWTEANCQGERFVWTTDYTDLASGFTWSPSILLVTITDAHGVIRLTACPAGAPYARSMVTSADDYTIREWGSVLVNGEVIGRFYWQSHFTYAPSTTNHCWKGPDSTRPGLAQDEAWWDSFSGWFPPQGPTTGTPYAPDTSTVDPGVTVTRRNVFAYHGGAGWNDLICVTSIVGW